MTSSLCRVVRMVRSGGAGAESTKEKKKKRLSPISAPAPTQVIFIQSKKKKPPTHRTQKKWG
jgi:hypothetical protein